MGRLILFGLVLVTTLTVSVGCNSSTSKQTEAPTKAGEPQYGGALIMTDGATMPFLDAHRNTSIPTLSSLGNIHPTVLAEDTQNRGALVGILAESWEASPVGLTYTFKIRQLTTHKGKSFNAEDVAYNLMRFVKRPNGIPMPRSGCVRDQVQEAKAVDPTTLVVTLKRRSSTFITCLSSAYLMIQPKYILEEIDGPGKGRDLKPEEVDGVGSFKFVEWVPENRAIIDRFDGYYKQGLPYLDRIVQIGIPDSSSEIAAFRTKRAHMFAKFASTPKFSEAEALKKEFGDSIQVKDINAPGFRGFHVNPNRPPLQDLRVREAIDLAFNRQNERALLMEGKGEFAGPYFCRWGWIFTCDEFATWPGYRADKTEDLARARRLLEEAGYGSGLTLTANCGTTSPDACVLLKDDLSKLGIELKIKRQEGQVNFDQVRKGDYDFFATGRGIGLNDPDAYNELLYLPESGENFARWQNPRFLELHAQQQQETDQRKRGQILREMGKIVYDAHIFLHGNRETLYQTWWSCVKGYVPPATFVHTNYTADQVWLEGECRSFERR